MIAGAELPQTRPSVLWTSAQQGSFGMLAGVCGGGGGKVRGGAADQEKLTGTRHASRREGAAAVGELGGCVISSLTLWHVSTCEQHTTFQHTAVVWALRGMGVQCPSSMGRAAKCPPPSPTPRCLPTYASVLIRTEGWALPHGMGIR